jgi:peptidoglycan hydrolase CwlO-like protein
MSDQINGFDEIATIYQALTHQIERMTAIDARVERLEQQVLDKDRLIQLLSDENKRLKSKIKQLETEIQCPYCNKVFDMWIEEA